MSLHSSVRRLRAASILPLLALAAACDGDPGGAVPADRPVALAAGGGHNCALTGAGTAYCWGSNARGQLGDGTVNPSLAPVRANAPERLTAISAQSNQTCAVGASGSVYCWGLVAHRADPQAFNTPTPSRLETELRFTQVSAATLHACALTAQGRAYCWGTDQYGALGDGPGGPTSATTPVPVSTQLEFTSIHAAPAHTCAMARTGRAYCWGTGGFGLFGGSAATTVPAPVAAGSDLRFTSLDTGASWACGVSSGDVQCWGRGRAGERGILPTAAGLPEPPPNRVEGLPDVDAVFSARQNAVTGHVCALTGSGEAHCWGENGDGEVGIEPGDARNDVCVSGFQATCVTRPVRAAGTLRFRMLAPSVRHTCGITREHEIHCWGYSGQGQLGPAGGAGGPTPVRVDLPES